MRGRFGRIAPNAGLLALSLLLCPLALEVGLRSFGYGAVGEREGNVVHHVVHEFRHDAVLNSLDLRDREIGPKPPDELRVLALGDSFTYGLGVEEPQTFVRRTESLLRDRAREAVLPAAVRVINGGVGGGPFRQEKWLREVGLGLAPDLVVHAFFIGNDVYDALAWQKTRGASEQPGRGWRGSLRQSVLLDWTWARLTRLPVLDRWLFDRGLRYQDYGLHLRDMPQVERQGWELVRGVLKQEIRLLRERDVPLLVMIIPSSAQVRYGDQRPPEQDNELPNRILEEFLTEQGAPFLDLLPRIEQQPEKDGFYYTLDLHWTSRGHRFAAEVLAETLWPVVADRARLLPLGDRP